MAKITPFLWFDHQAEEAVDFYLSVFPNSRIVRVSRQPGSDPDTPGPAVTVHFELDGNEFVALNGGPAHYNFDESISFVVNCPTEADVDYYWDALVAGGGAHNVCGWLNDRYGVRWQIVPEGLPALLTDPDQERVKRAMAAMMKMTKLDLNAMRQAADGQ